MPEAGGRRPQMAIIGEQLGCGGFSSVWGWQVIESGKDPVGASRNQQSNALWHETGIETMRRLPSFLAVAVPQNKALRDANRNATSG